MPFGLPIPPSPGTSKALLKAFQQRNIQFIAQRKVHSLAASGRVVMLDDGTELPCDLFLRIPKHVAPKVVLQSGLAENRLDTSEQNQSPHQVSRRLCYWRCNQYRYTKAGVFAEGAAKIAAASIIAAFNGNENSTGYNGAGTCYIEYGNGEVGKVDVDFLGPQTCWYSS